MEASAPHQANAYGFTLIELMAVVVVAAVLLVIVIPTYTSQIRSRAAPTPRPRYWISRDARSATSQPTTYTSRRLPLWATRVSGAAIIPLAAATIISPPRQ